MLINGMFAHGFISREVMSVIISPIVKKKNLDDSDSANYRPIALASVFSKIIELVILKECGIFLQTTDNQFGYKKGVGAEFAVYTVKQVAHYYLRRSTPVFAAYLDATKAFDIVNQFSLLKKMCNRNIP